MSGAAPRGDRPRRAAACVVAATQILAIGAAAACARRRVDVTEDGATRTLEIHGPPATPFTNVDRDGGDDDAADAPIHYLPTDDEIDASNLPLTVTSVRPGERAPPDPDLEVVAAARVAAARCFDGVQVSSAARSVLLDVVVVPTGRVTRVALTAPDTPEPAVVECLKRVGRGLTFPARSSLDADLRSFAIDVALVRDRG